MNEYNNYSLQNPLYLFTFYCQSAIIMYSIDISEKK